MAPHLHITPNGQSFISTCRGKKVKLWKYAKLVTTMPPHKLRSVLELETISEEAIQGKYAYISGRDFERWFGGDESSDYDSDIENDSATSNKKPLMVLQLTGTTGLIRYVAVAGCHSAGLNEIYLPVSTMQEFALHGCAEATARVIYELEHATKIILKPLDPILYHAGDIRDILEQAMMDFPLLQKHTQFSVELPQLGGYVADVWVDACEPAEIVQLGGEVELEIVAEEAEAEAEAPAPAPAAPPALPPPPPFTPSMNKTPTAPSKEEQLRMRELRAAYYSRKN
jgi:hypothetical protein